MRPLLRQIVLIAARLVVLPLALTWWIGRALTHSDTLFASIAQAISLLPGRSGSYVRRAFYALTLPECADDVHIEFGTLLNYPTTRLAKGVYIGTYCTLGMVAIGEGTMIGSNVDILSSRHQHRREGNRLLGAEAGSFKTVRIGRNTWIGNSAIIMANVGQDCTIGAGTVVVKDVDAGLTVVGNPARVVAQRTVDPTGTVAP